MKLGLQFKLICLFFTWLQLGNWDSAIGDYEILRKETPEDEEVTRGLSEAQKQLVKRRGHDS